MNPFKFYLLRVLVLERLRVVVILRQDEPVLVGVRKGDGLKVALTVMTVREGVKLDDCDTLLHLVTVELVLLDSVSDFVTVRDFVTV